MKFIRRSLSIQLALLILFLTVSDIIIPAHTLDWILFFYYRLFRFKIFLFSLLFLTTSGGIFLKCFNFFHLKVLLVCNIKIPFHSLSRLLSFSLLKCYRCCCRRHYSIQAQDIYCISINWVMRWVSNVKNNKKSMVRDERRRVYHEQFWE